MANDRSAGNDAVVPVREQSVASERGGWNGRDTEHSQARSDPQGFGSTAGANIAGMRKRCRAISYLNNATKECPVICSSNADLKSQSTPSSKFHGMRCVCCWATEPSCRPAPSVLDSPRCSSRFAELDHAERQFIADHGLPTFRVPRCPTCSLGRPRKVTQTGLSPVDLDVIDPHDF